MRRTLSLARALLVASLAEAVTVDLLAGDSTYVSVDSVMGGQSVAQVNTDNNGTHIFEGEVSIVGGGFAYLTFSGGVSKDLSSATGLSVQFTTMKYSPFGSAPIAFSIELKSSATCSLVAAFAVPTTELAEASSEWVPLDRFAAKGSHWSYSASETGVPSNCQGATTSLADVQSCSVGVYYQDGPFRLALNALEAFETQPTKAVLASTPAPDLIWSAAERAIGLVNKAGAGVGAHQMNSLAGAVLETAAVQSAEPDLLTAVSTSYGLEVAERVARLQTALATWLSDHTPPPTREPTANPTLRDSQETTKSNHPPSVALVPVALLGTALMIALAVVVAACHCRRRGRLIAAQVDVSQDDGTSSMQCAVAIVGDQKETLGHSTLAASVVATSAESGDIGLSTICMAQRIKIGGVHSVAL